MSEQAFHFNDDVPSRRVGEDDYHLVEAFGDVYRVPTQIYLQESEQPGLDTSQAYYLEANGAVVSVEAKVHPLAAIGARTIVRALAFIDEASIGPECLIKRNAKVYSGVSAGKKVRVGRGSSVKSDVILEPRVRLKDDVIIEEGAKVRNGATVENGVIVGPGVVVWKDARVTTNLPSRGTQRPSVRH